MCVIYEDAQGETDYVDNYYCDLHKPKPSKMVPEGGKWLATQENRRLRYY